MLIAGHLLLHRGQASFLERGWVLCRGSTIEACGTGEAPAAPDLGGDDHIIMPGFIDAHVHLPQYDSIGVSGLELLEWLDRVIFPAETRWADPDAAADMAERATMGLISFGTTGFAAYGSSHSASVKQAFAAVASLGVHGCFGPSLMDRNAPEELCAPRSEQISLLAEFEPIGRLVPAVTPRFAVSCTPEMMREAAMVARVRSWPIQTHLSETHAELRLIHDLFGGRAYADVYDECGLLTPRTILAHAIHLTSPEIERIASRGSIIAHCPTANRFLEAGIMDRATLSARRIPVAIGSDVAGGPDRSMVRVARAMIESARARGNLAPTPAEAFFDITRGNALALGHPSRGVLTSGADADVLLIKPDEAWDRSESPFGFLLYGWDDRWIRRVMVGGKWMYES